MGDKSIGISVIASAVFVLVIVILLIVCSVFATEMIDNGLAAAEEAFVTTANNVKNDIYQESYKAAYDKAFEDNKVSNDVVLVVEDVREMSSLEVLKVSTVQYVIENAEDNNEDFSVWLEVPGFGVYTVNLGAGEYIIDNERRSITVRVPEPVLQDYGIDYTKVEKLLFENGGFYENYGAGEEHAREHLKQAYNEIGKELRDARYYNKAVASAEKLIKSLVTELNRDVEGLVVQVEFMR